MALVQLMTPGLALFYGGLVRETSVITMIMQNFSTMGIVTIMWYLFLYSMCFGETIGFFGNPIDYAFFRNVTTKPGPMATEIPHLLFAGFQGMFAVIAPALMTGAFADRFCYGPFLIFVVVWMIVVYAPFCHWVWGGGWMAEIGVWDFAGGIVVHITAGFSALATLLVVGKRQVPEGATIEDLDKPSNLPMVALGTALLWFGWFGFNGGSAMSSNGVAVVAAINSEIAASVACFVWMCLDWATKRKPSLIGKCVGAIAGLATVTPAAGFVQPWAAGHGPRVVRESWDGDAFRRTAGQAIPRRHVHCCVLVYCYVLVPQCAGQSDASDTHRTGAGASRRRLPWRSREHER
eukprot:TRINITY_DN15814_c0_g1_i2.p1 TRINITY_DN15814_c0_g1~~TRINITY_DN15814_c0_g1_i2.p1  ORF type:complete len:392 (-),score=43.35 TRINITY_DN15814_c0_g1_i2:667-1713(-)